MAVKRQPRLTKEQKISLAQEANQSERLPILARRIDETLALTDQWRAVTEEHKEIVLYRLSAGDTIKNICRLMGVDAGPFYMLRHVDPEFALRYDQAIRSGAMAIADEIRGVSRDTTLSETSKAIELKALTWLAAKHDRKTYGDQIQVEHSQKATLNVPDWMGSIIEGQVIPDAPTPDPESSE